MSARKSGATYRQIAQATIAHFGVGALPKNYDWRYAHKDVSRELEKLNRSLKHDLQEIKRMELERLDVALRAIWGQVQKGHLGAIDRFVRLSQRRARLCGLDAPKKTDITSGGEPIGPVIYLPTVDSGDD